MFDKGKRSCTLTVRLPGDEEWWSDITFWLERRSPTIVEHIVISRPMPLRIPESEVWRSVYAMWGQPDSVDAYDDRWWAAGDRIAHGAYARPLSRLTDHATLTLRLWEEPGRSAKAAVRSDSLARAKRRAAEADSARLRSFIPR